MREATPPMIELAVYYRLPIVITSGLFQTLRQPIQVSSGISLYSEPAYGSNLAFIRFQRDTYIGVVPHILFLSPLPQNPFLKNAEFRLRRHAKHPRPNIR